MRKRGLRRQIISLPRDICFLEGLESSILAVSDRHHIILRLIYHTRVVMNLIHLLCLIALTFLTWSWFVIGTLDELHWMISDYLSLLCFVEGRMPKK